jgi:hypothetical protein
MLALAFNQEQRSSKIYCRQGAHRESGVPFVWRGATLFFMSMVLLPCFRCWAETADVEHSEEDCAAQRALNDLVREATIKANAAWKAKLAAMTPEERASRPRIVFPDGRVVKPSGG